jgi:predicted GNAT superfamily acetyltransferase
VKRVLGPPHNPSGLPRRHAGEVITALTEMEELTAAADLLAAIWGYPPDQGPVTPELLRALAHSGNYVAGAWDGDVLVGASAGFLGRHDDELHLHSHISGVDPGHQGGNVGFAIKQHQREWALTRGIAIIEWTFDPLVRRNAYFNLAKLGARVVGYQPHFYGPMRDALNVGDETDRAVVCWRLDRVEPAPADTTGVVVLRAGEDGRPVVDKSDADVLKAWVPEDVVALRQHDPETALAWRTALRDTLGSAVGDGYAATDMSRDGWYTIERTGS